MHGLHFDRLFERDVTRSGPLRFRSMHLGFEVFLKRSTVFTEGKGLHGGGSWREEGVEGVCGNLVQANRRVHFKNKDGENSQNSRTCSIPTMSSEPIQGEKKNPPKTNIHRR